MKNLVIAALLLIVMGCSKEETGPEIKQTTQNNAHPLDGIYLNIGSSVGGADDYIEIKNGFTQIANPYWINTQPLVDTILGIDEPFYDWSIADTTYGLIGDFYSPGGTTPTNGRFRFSEGYDTLKIKWSVKLTPNGATSYFDYNYVK